MPRAAGVREVKNNLSAYLRDVQRGAVVRITDRGRVVAELRRPAAAPGEEPEYERLVAEGKVIAPARRWGPSLVRTSPSGGRLPRGAAAALVDADRDGT